MKTKHILTTLAISTALFASSCKKNLEEINLDPTHITAGSMDYKLLFTAAEVYTSGTDYDVWRNNLIYASTFMQHLSSTQSYWNGDKYTYSAGYNSAYWDRNFPNQITNIMEVVNHYKADAANSNGYNIARIIRVIAFQRMTDLYGDIPYSEAGLGYISGITKPKYDTQQAIYADLLKELSEAAAALDAAKTNTFGAADLVYKGDAGQWKKFAYSQMLRMGMRLSKVDQANAQKWVQAAVAGGLFASNTDNAMIAHDANTTDASNGNGKVLTYQDPNATRVSKTFIDYLRTTKDPRMRYIATVATNPGIGFGTTGFDYGDTTATKQIGMPNGYDENGAATDISKASNWPGNLNGYSIVNRYTLARVDAPTFLLTYSENQLLLAEAALRGWVTGDAATYYKSGVTAAMQQFTQTGGGAGVTDAEIAAYLGANPFSIATGYAQINNQYWVATFLDEYESWSNWRRSGFPVLTPVVYFGNVTNGTIPRRFTYPVSEASANSDNYVSAVSRYAAGDRMTSRVWWDVAQ